MEKTLKELNAEIIIEDPTINFDGLDDLGDFDLVEFPITYEVWLLGFDVNGEATDFDALIDGDYTTLEEAKHCMDYASDSANFAEVLTAKKIQIPENVKHVYLWLEATVKEGDGTTCVELLEEKEIY